MKNKRILWILVCSLIVLTSRVHGQAESPIPFLSDADIENLANVKNPFVPQIPDEPEPQPEPSPVPQPPVVIKNPEPVRPAPVRPTPEPPRPAPVEQQIPELIEGKFVLTGVIWNSDRPQAIINNEVVEVGDMVGLFKVVAIKKEGVDLSFHKIVRTLKINN